MYRVAWSFRLNKKIIACWRLSILFSLCCSCYGGISLSSLDVHRNMLRIKLQSKYPAMSSCSAWVKYLAVILSMSWFGYCWGLMILVLLLVRSKVLEVEVIKLWIMSKHVITKLSLISTWNGLKSFLKDSEMLLMRGLLFLNNSSCPTHQISTWWTQLDFQLVSYNLLIGHDVW